MVEYYNPESENAELILSRYVLVIEKVMTWTSRFEGISSRYSIRNCQMNIRWISRIESDGSDAQVPGKLDLNDATIRDPSIRSKKAINITLTLLFSSLHLNATGNVNGFKNG